MLKVPGVLCLTLSAIPGLMCLLPAVNQPPCAECASSEVRTRYSM